MRRRFFRRGRRGNIAQMWVPSASFGTGVTLGQYPTPAVQTVLAGTTGSPAQDPPIIQRFSVMRIRGEIGYAWNLDTTLDYAKGFHMRLGIIVDQVSTAGTETYDPSIPADAPSPWLWLTTVRIFWALAVQPTGMVFPTAYGIVNNAQGTVPVDVKVRRTLMPNQRLVLVGQITSPATLTGQVQIAPYLRTLIRKVG